MSADTDKQVENLNERIRLTAAALVGPGMLSRHDLSGLLPVPGNANPYVPWDDPQIPYECYCGQIIYADSDHIHPDDDPIYIDRETAQKEDNERMQQLRSKLNIDEVVELAIALFKEHDVKHYLEDHGDEFRGAGRAYEAGDAVRAAMARLDGLDDYMAQYDESAPSWWPEAEARVRDAVPNYEVEIARRQKLGYRP